MKDGHYAHYPPLIIQALREARKTGDTYLGAASSLNRSRKKGQRAVIVKGTVSKMLRRIGL